jgi:hypothetical protein
MKLFERLGADLRPTKAGDSLAPRWLSSTGKPVWPFFLRHSTARLDLALANLSYRPGFQAEDIRREALKKLRETGLDVQTTGNLNGYPSVALAALAKIDARNAFEAFARWIVERAKEE